MPNKSPTSNTCRSLLVFNVFRTSSMIVRNLIAALREDDTVYVNDLGLFRKVFSRAHVEEKQVFPPRYSVLLDAEEEGSGYAFILFVSKAENIRIVDADLAIRRWVEKLTEELRKGRNVTVEGFGTFSLKKNKLEFTAAAEIPELNAEFDGLEPIDIQKYPKQKHPERTEVLPPFEAPEPIIEPEPVVEQEPVVEPEPMAEPEPIVEPEPVVETEHNDVEVSRVELETEPVVEKEPVPVVVPEHIEEMEPVAEPEPIIEPEPVIKPEPVVEPEPIFEPEPIIEPEPQIEEESEPEEEAEHENEAEEVDETDSATNEEPATEPKKRWGWIVFVVLLLLAVGILGWFFKDDILDFYHQKFDKEPIVDDTTAVVTTPVEEPVVMDTIAQTDSLGTAEEEYIEPEPETKPFDINNLEHINYEKGKYYLVHGSFSQEPDCASHIRSHHFETYSPTILHQSGNARMRVCLGVFNSEEESMQFASSHGIKDAWTLK